MKEELNNTLLSCLAEEAKSAHAAQEAIEFCRAAGMLHLSFFLFFKKLYSTPRLPASPHASLSRGRCHPVRETEAGHGVAAPECSQLQEARCVIVEALRQSVCSHSGLPLA